MDADEKVALLRAKHVARAADEFDFLDSMTGVFHTSPIERVFVAALAAMDWRIATEPNMMPVMERLDRPEVHAGLEAERARGVPDRGHFALDHAWLGAIMVCQLTLVLGEREMRLDFAALMGPACFAIELDGHQFHERTKSQAERDKSRDRLLTAAGWHPVRFAGSEIWRDPLKVVDELKALLVRHK